MQKFTAKSHPRAGAFSLVELLVVIAIVSILMVVAMGAFSMIGRAGDLTKTGYDIAGLIEQARSHAMAQNTYVWVGLKNLSQGNVDSIVVGVVGARSGESNPDPDDGLIQLGRVRRFENFRIVSGLPNEQGGLARPSASQGASLPGIDAVYAFSVGSGSNKVTFDEDVLQFNSRGEARMTTSPKRVIEIGLQSFIDGKVINPDNFAVIQIGGLTGAVTLYRP